MFLMSTMNTAQVITVPCELCFVEYDVSKMIEYVCRRCKITICNTCKVRDNAISFCDHCQMEVCAECDETNQCINCYQEVCTMCGGTTQCDECECMLCEECTQNHDCG